MAKKSSNRNITFDASYTDKGFDEASMGDALNKMNDPILFRKENVGFIQTEEGATAYWTLGNRNRKIRKDFLPRIFSDINADFITKNPTGLVNGVPYFDSRLKISPSKKKSKSRVKQEETAPPFEGDFPNSMWGSIADQCKKKIESLKLNDEEVNTDTVDLGMQALLGLLSLKNKLKQYTAEMGFHEMTVKENGTKRAASEIEPVAVAKKPKGPDKREPNVEVTKHELTYYEGKNSGVIPELEEYIAKCSYVRSGETWCSLDYERVILKKGFAEALDKEEESPQMHDFYEIQAAISGANTVKLVSELDKNLVRFLHAICEIIYAESEDALVNFSNPKCPEDDPIVYTVFKGYDLEIKGMVARNYEPDQSINAIMMNKGKTFRAFLYHFIEIGDVPERDKIIAASLSQDDTHEEIQKYAIPILAFFDFLFPEFIAANSKVLKEEFTKFKAKYY